MDVYEEEKILARYWNLVEKFRGKKGIGMGDIRAYVSACVDLEVIESGIKKSDDLINILQYVIKGFPKNDV